MDERDAQQRDKGKSREEKWGMAAKYSLGLTINEKPKSHKFSKINTMLLPRIRKFSRKQTLNLQCFKNKDSFKKIRSQTFKVL